MQQYENSSSTLLVINRGEEVMAHLNAFAKEHQLQSAWVSGLGGAGSVTLGFYNLTTRDYEWTTCSDPLEILNLTGNLSWVDGEPFWHVHGTFSGQDLQALGGHVQSLDVALTCELLVTPLQTAMTRNYDEATGLKLLGDSNETA